jgi:long-chain acyl-CoA synthetase
MVHGDNRLYNVALVVPDLEAVKKWAAGEGLSFGSDEELINNARVRTLIQGEVDRYSAEWKGFERVKKVTLCPEDFTAMNGMLTPSLKVKRRVVWQKYQGQIEALYEDAADRAKSETVAA